VFDIFERDVQGGSRSSLTRGILGASAVFGTEEIHNFVQTLWTTGTNSTILCEAAIDIFMNFVSIGLSTGCEGLYIECLSRRGLYGPVRVDCGVLRTACYAGAFFGAWGLKKWLTQWWGLGWIYG